uniref:ATP-dependent Clp protease proteolytic subunit n=1 Tax=Compsopogon caeruleus TaxID=31354 RepID=A0A7S1T5N5_9RHOD|mmetsp:Transcript_11189/g.22281  ORF Transcript_11189/g.22281 Transcript_11189/m.22281 type:complete len:256 (+) Transcript_11189:86-853(+)|eukprot:CAMPEP_0184683976 /NCGR_PEP_ID=MMETSP0312-20130426/13400_1 /TAXON_ID=31354 /ORGANISM="Compsopogon coeruleus, Strain SAG 36.94" /LENGTH=255 /DNA_ID=CAMNT_0027136741 /DNA_START=38 /DNA_END=805 /DNA_ORIENTATION=-
MVGFVGIFGVQGSGACRYRFICGGSGRSVFVSGSVASSWKDVRSGVPRSPPKWTMMPIGVPKVAYRIPGSAQAEWVDIYNRLYRERIMFLGQEIDDEIANQLIAVMLYLDADDNTKPIYMYINSPGGSVVAGLAIFDTMQHIKSEVVTINCGLAASMASFLLGAGEKGKRLALPHSRTMIHQPMGGAQGQASDIKVEAEQIIRIKKMLTLEYAKMTGQTYERLLKDMDRDNFMSAYEAKDYGLVDQVIEGQSTAA